MNKGLKFVSWLLALGIGAALVLPLEAQNPNRPPKPRQEQRQERRQERRNERNANRPPANVNRAQNQNASPNTNRPPERARNQQNPNRPPANTQPRNFNSLNPEEKQRALNNNRDFQRRTPAERAQIKQNLQNWNRLTPEQKNHVKNEVLPRWQQLPADRQRAIRSRLNVLQNMPESARNQHLADPNFTRGMNEEDKAMLQDLSHLHVGGAPEEPHE
jgi:hypothetical protein